MYSTRCAQDTARDAVQIFGGRGITQTGMGRLIEHASRLLAWYAALLLTVSNVLSIIERSLSIRF